LKLSLLPFPSELINLLLLQAVVHIQSLHGRPYLPLRVLVASSLFGSVSTTSELFLELGGGEGLVHDFFRFLDLVGFERDVVFWWSVMFALVNLQLFYFWEIIRSWIIQIHSVKVIVLLIFLSNRFCLSHDIIKMLCQYIFTFLIRSMIINYLILL
jgi:hypothetical protein